MKAEQATGGRRVVRRYSAGDRDRLIREYHASGQTKKDFCDGRGVNLGTFHGWFKKPENAKPKLAEVEVGRSGAPIEIELPDGRRIGLHLNGESVELAKLIRGVLQC